MTARTYGWLMAGGGGDVFDRHLFACAIAVAQICLPGQPLAASLGLSAESMAALVGEFFPHAPMLLAHLTPGLDGGEPLTADETALRQLLMDHRTAGAIEEAWLAHIIARRAQLPGLLWQNLGVTSRADLGLTMVRHYAPLAARNTQDMRWKPFFWREIEMASGWDCRATGSCRHCRDHPRCFGQENGASLISSHGSSAHLP